MNVEYDPINKRLLYFSSAATPEYWDKHWEKSIDKINKSSKSEALTLTKKYLKKGSQILEGGCGFGQHVSALFEAEYDVIGVDFAEKIVSEINKRAPHLNVKIGDLRNLEFEDNTFDGYWSLGVIEHFYDGYDSLISEMYRVLKPGGYLIISFPSMSPLRRLKAKLSMYKEFTMSDSEPSNFYQFALFTEDVKRNLIKKGFTFKKQLGVAGLKGIKDEIPFTRPMLEKFYSTNIFLIKVVGFIFNKIVSPFAYHSKLLIFRK
tara:strand:+ start:309 stop:1094 length:786 start_codon:yes stop_codon:yes gene_type:complete